MNQGPLEVEVAPGLHLWFFFTTPLVLYLIAAVFELGVVFLQDQVEGHQRHEQPVAHVPEHHREQEGEGDDGEGS